MNIEIARGSSTESALRDPYESATSGVTQARQHIELLLVLGRLGSTLCRRGKPAAHVGRRARDNAGMERDKSEKGNLKGRLPPWLLGLILAAILFGVALVLANILGFGDDPVVGGLASMG